MPAATSEKRSVIAAAAKELNALREQWLNPPEWTTTVTLEFSGAADGPWSRYVHDCNADGIGIVRYPLSEARDAECAGKLAKRTLTNLYNERPSWLQHAHEKLDAAVAVAYGWPVKITDEQILERLLSLNIERAGQEAKVGHTGKSVSQRPKQSDEIL